MAPEKSLANSPMEMNDLMKLSGDELRFYLHPEDLKNVESGETVLICGNVPVGETDELVQIEIALRRGDRVGLFSNR